MNRIEAVQQALDGPVRRVYLEIGVSHGASFQRITADEKIAVDPAFKLSARTRRLADAKARATHYFETTSDAFFANETAFLEQHGIDVALIDGLHTYAQVVRDVENTLHYLRDNGVIVLHDCNPADALIACPVTSYADFLRRTTGCAEPLGGASTGAATSGRRSSTCAAPGTTCESRYWSATSASGSYERDFRNCGLPYSAAQVEALDYRISPPTGSACLI